MSSDGKGVIIAKVYRSNPLVSNETKYETYQVKTERSMTVLAMLRYIFRTLDPTLAFRDYECYQGVCMSCQVMVKGKRVRACSILVEPGEEVTIEPLPGHRVIRDLVVSFEQAEL